MWEMCGFFSARSSAEKNAADIKVRLDGFSGRSSRKGKTLFFVFNFFGLMWEALLIVADAVPVGAVVNFKVDVAAASVFVFDTVVVVVVAAAAPAFYVDKLFVVNPVQKGKFSA